MSALHVVATALLASGESKKSGPIGLAVILGLCVLCYFLFKSMSKHMRKVREEFPVPGERVPEPGTGDAAEPMVKRATDVPGPSAQDDRGDSPTPGADE
jgi:hypothetical protein